ncbi:MAG: GIY-YIG nuclease family protein, partial [Patescibacteria group bacterium]
MPDSSGVYKFQDNKKQDIYIGKASSLKKRLLSYTKTTDSRINKMIVSATNLIHLETDSDIEALILESQLIKQKRPQFNIMLRDDKQYFFVAFTNDEYPRIFLTHQPNSTGGTSLSPVAEGGPRSGQGEVSQRRALAASRIASGTDGTGSKGLGKRIVPPVNYIGPFTEGTSLKTTLKFLRNIFPYCTCTQKHHNFCLNYHIGKCTGYCCLKGEQSKEQHQKYLANVKAIRDTLSGKKSSLLKELKKEMTIAGKKH